LEQYSPSYISTYGVVEADVGIGVAVAADVGAAVATGVVTIMYNVSPASSKKELQSVV
jgi:hypothetical protein